MANPLHPWDWPGRPDGIWLHTKCRHTKVAKVATSHKQASR